MLETFLASKWGGYVIMVVVFGAIVLLLRTLFGPKGLLRDPAWDETNRQLRAEEEEKRKRKE